MFKTSLLPIRFSRFLGNSGLLGVLWVLLVSTSIYATSDTIPSAAAWIDPTPVEIGYGQFIPADFDSAIAWAAHEWSVVTGEFYYHEDELNYNCDVYMVNLGFGVLGETVLAVVSDEITGAELRINSYYQWEFWTSPTTASDDPFESYHLVRVMMHEFGHVAGINHINTTNAAMYNGNADVFINTLHQDDQDELTDKYGTSSPDDDGVCKPALANSYSPGAGLGNLIYVANLVQSNDLLGESYSQIFGSRRAQILNAITSDPGIRARANRFAETLARDLNASIVKGGDYHIPLTFERIEELDELLGFLAAEVDFGSEMEQFRYLLRTSHGKSFWSLFSDDSYQRTTSLPLEPKLHRNIPNPFNPNTTIFFDIPKDVYVTLKIYSSNSQLVRTLVAQTVSAGVRQVVWNGRNDTGQKVGSGTYFVKLSIPSLSYSDHIKMTLLK